ncbi:glucose-6-phosphate isomerase [archaeon]|nr:glucose-6-phosphate isomerase [archaeon]
MDIFAKKPINKETQVMVDVYENWPEYAQESYDNAKPISVKFEKVIFCGMGGSGLVFDILSSLISDKQVVINKGYVLPKDISNSLMIFNSASGDTIETITAIESALESKNKIIAFSSGGKLEEFCKKNNITHIKYDLKSSPRASLPVSLYTILGTLSDSFGIEKSIIIKSIQSLRDTKKKIFGSLDSNPAIDLAEFIKDGAVCYYSPELFPVALRFSQDFQENCKKFATQGDVVESCHNFINSWENLTNFSPILLRGQPENEYIKKRFEVWIEYFETREISYRELYSVEGDLLTQFMTLMYEMGMSTIYHAVQNDIDPTLLEAIDFVKARV